MPSHHDCEEFEADTPNYINFMNRTNTALLLWCSLICLGSFSILAQDENQGADFDAALEGFRKMDEWSVREFQLPLSSLVGPGRGQKGRSSPEAPPEVKMMEYHVGVLPKGTAFLYDSASWTLAVRSTNEALQRIQHFCETVTGNVPAVLNFKMEVFESRSGADSGLHEKLIATHDHTIHAEALRKLAEKGEATVLAVAQWDGRSGQRAHVVCDHPETASRLELEIDPTLGHSGVVDVNLHFEHFTAPPAERQIPDVHAEATSTMAATLQCGRARVVGMWKPRGSGKDVIRTAVLTVDAMPVLPEKNTQLAEKLQVSGGLAGSAKTSNPQDIPVPRGLVLRQIRCPMNLYHLWQDYEVQDRKGADPFLDTQEEAPEDPSLGQTGSIQEILEQQGIHFQGGARIYYHRPTCRLVVLNTQDNIDQIQSFLDGLMFHPSVVLRSALQIVEGEAAQIRSLVAATEGLADHTAAWKLMEEMVAKGEIRQSALWITETRSGQKESVFSGEAWGGGSKSKNQNQEDEEGEEPIRIGTRLALEPIIRADGYTLEVNVDLVQHGADEIEKAIGGVAAHSISTSAPMINGKPVLLGVWSATETPVSGKAKLQAVFLKVHMMQLIYPEIERTHSLLDGSVR